jgi:nucleoside-diphosphate-sugar epimerase
MIRMMATGADETGPINIGSQSEVTIRELAEAVIELTNSRSQLVYRPAPADDPKRRSARYSAGGSGSWVAPDNAASRRAEKDDHLL